MDTIVKGKGKNGLSFNQGLAKEMYKGFAEKYEIRAGLYERFHHTNSEVVVWHKFLPEGIAYASVEHRQYLFGANLLDAQTKAETAFIVASRLWDEYPELFGPKVLDFGSKNEHHRRDLFPELLSDSCWSPVEVLADRLKKAGYTSPNQMASRWRDSFAMLWSDFEGDPLKIFDVYKTVTDYLQARKESKRGGRPIFPGLGVKLFSLLAFHLEELGLIDYIDGSLPVDLHLQSQHLSARVVTGFGIHPAGDLENFIRPRAVEICLNNNIPPFIIAASMWFNGSEYCVRCDKRRSDSQQKVIAGNCPIYNLCGGRVRNVLLYRALGSWDLGDFTGERWEQPQLDCPQFFELTAPKKEVKLYRSRRSGRMISG